MLIIPLDIVKANEGKPIPYGLWDTYRQTYNWILVTELLDDAQNKDIGIHFLNGNWEELFGETLIQKYPKIISDNVRYNTLQKRNIPSKLDFSWLDENRYYCEIKFNEEEILSAFKEITSSNSKDKIELRVRVNIPKTSASVQLTNGDKHILLKNNEIMVRKTKYTY